MKTLTAYDAIFDSLLRAIGGKVDKPLCREIRRILFKGFDPHWIAENQKFDFSFSSPGNADFRFSVSDYGEKDAFEEKLARIFTLFGGRYDGGKLSQVLSVTRRTNRYHQTTFGLEWKASDARPRLKVYFEELRHRYSIPARGRLLKLICAAAGLRMPRRGAAGDIAALCVDFLPDKDVMLKSYDYSDWKHLEEGAPAALAGFTDILSDEKRAFFYKTRRYDHDAVLQSQKLYKVYEVRQIEDFTPALLEINKAIERFGTQKDVADIGKYSKMAARKGSLWYPVLCAMDIDTHGGIKIDSYFSVRRGSGSSVA